MKKPLIQFKDATLGYGRVPILSHVDLEIQPQSFVGILGHNGSGKTALLKTILGLIPCIKGRRVTRGRPRYGYVPQKERLDPIYPLSAYDVAAMGTFRTLDLLARWRRKDVAALVQRCLAQCGAAQLAQTPYSDLSGGQKQRVLIARALAAEPEVLALDEPLSGIDITTQKALLELLRRVKEERRLTILMVSHRVQVEKDLFSHIVWCDEGQALMGETGAMLAGGRLGEVFKAEL
ncbi:MAG TPA: metal ABC transporter ATP-binding protein [Elusimicrobia bacterium]|nr:metal ABC transporter ATP-binding protein [Elusimicrobiota bacterium]HBT61261.1 metal ABC transporter ATP-binding protein [Elusimicrobiota bacterium]